MSWLVQVTVPPTDSVNVFGEKLNLSIATSVFVALTGADSLVWASLLCVKELAVKQDTGSGKYGT